MGTPPAPPQNTGRAGLVALLAGGLLGAAPRLGRLAGADPSGEAGPLLALVAFGGSGLWLLGALVLLRWTLRRGGRWYVAAAGLVLAVVRGTTVHRFDEPNMPTVLQQGDRVVVIRHTGTPHASHHTP